MSEAAGMDADERVAIPELLLGALGFYRAPQRFAQLRDPAQPLPAGVTELLAAGAQSLAPEQIAATAARLGSNPQELQDAVLFFIRQAMLEAGGDHYRTLGVARDADTALIRQHYHYLIRLFHPDRDVENEAWDAPYATAVNEAWNVLRNPQKRAAYDASLAQPSQHLAVAANRSGATPGPAGQRAARPHRTHGGAARRWNAAGRLGLAVLACLALALGWLSLRQPAQPALRVTVPAAVATAGAPVEGAGSPARNASDRRAGSDDRTAPRDAASEQPRERAEVASDASIEERVRAKMKQATMAALGPERARASGRAAPEPAPARSEPVIEPTAERQAAQVAMPEPVGAAARAAAETTEPAPPPASQPQVAAVAASTAVRAPVASAMRALSDADLEAVLRELSRSYEAGDAERFAALFAEQAETTDATGRGAIQALYRDFFARPESRQMRIRKLRWREDGPYRSRGAGRVELVTAPFDGGAEARGVLELRVEVEQSPRGPRITGLHYQ